MKPFMKFFDSEFRMKTKKHMGVPIWEVESSYLRWMLDKGREGMGPLEVDIIRAFLAERKRLRDLIYQKEEKMKEEKDKALERYLKIEEESVPPLSSEEEGLFDAFLPQ